MIGRLVCVLCMTMSVMSREVHVPVKRGNQARTECYATLELETDVCYQGEPVSFQCYFYAPSRDVNNVRLAWSDKDPNIYVYPHSHVTESDNGVTWTWSGVWYPQSSGMNNVPQFYVSYEQHRRRKGRSGMLGSLWSGAVREQKEKPVCARVPYVYVYSTPDVDGVGQVRSCYWSHIPQQMQVGATYEIALCVSGSVNLPYMYPPHIEDQEGLHWFYIGDSMDHPAYADQRTYTYAVYVTQPGVYTLRAYPWHVFDPATECVYVCAPDDVTMYAYGDGIQGEEAHDTPFPEIDTHNASGEPYGRSRVRSTVLPMSWFFSVIATPIMLAGGYVGVQSLHRHYRRNYKRRCVTRALRRAHKAVMHAQYDDPALVYYACMHVFQALARYTGIQEHIVEQHVAIYAPGVEDEWREVWNTLQELTFSNQGGYLDASLRCRIRTCLRKLHDGWKCAPR